MIILQEIGNGCKELEELSIWIGRPAAPSLQLQPLQTLKTLRTLTLQYMQFEDFEFFSPLTELRVLTLVECGLPNDSNQFAALAQLMRLELKECTWHGVLDVVDMISRLINIGELRILSGVLGDVFVLDKKTFSEIVGIVKRRLHVLTLQCRSDFNVENCENNHMVKLLPAPLPYFK